MNLTKLQEFQKRAIRQCSQEFREKLKKDIDSAQRQDLDFLKNLEIHLFDGSQNINSLKKKAGIRDNGFASSFKSKYGLTPHRYSSEIRLKTAEKLLADYPFTCSDIAYMVGYNSLQAFSRAFKNWSGMRPLIHRETEKITPVDIGEMRKFCLGTLDSESAKTIIRQVSKKYPWLYINGEATVE